MTSQEQLAEIIRETPEDRIQQLLDFARFLSWQDEARAWSEFGKAQLANAYGDDEPEYTVFDLRKESPQ